LSGNTTHGTYKVKLILKFSRVRCARAYSGHFIFNKTKHYLDRTIESYMYHANTIKPAKMIVRVHTTDCKLKIKYAVRKGGGPPSIMTGI